MRKWWRGMLIGMVVVACNGGGGGGADPAAVEADVRRLADDEARGFRTPEGEVRATGADCPDDVSLEEGETFTCDVELDVGDETLPGEVDLEVDEDGELLLCSLNSEEAGIGVLGTSCS